MTDDVLGLELERKELLLDLSIRRELGELLRRWRRVLDPYVGLNQRQAARLAGVSQTRWCRLERGAADLSVLELVRFLVAADRLVRAAKERKARLGFGAIAFDVRQELEQLAELVDRIRQPELPNVRKPASRARVSRRRIKRSRSSSR